MLDKAAQEGSDRKEHKEWQRGAEGRKVKNQIREGATEIERLLAVLQKSSEADVQLEAMRQLQDALSHYVSVYAVYYEPTEGRHPSMPMPVRKAVDYCCGLVSAHPSTALAQMALPVVRDYLPMWRLEDLRGYEAQLLGFLTATGASVSAEPNNDATNTGKQTQEDLEREYQQRQAEANAIDIDDFRHRIACDLLTISLYPPRFDPNIPRSDAPPDPAEIDAKYASKLQPKIQQAATITGSPAIQSFASEIEDTLHELEVEGKVAGG